MYASYRTTSLVLTSIPSVIDNGQLPIMRSQNLDPRLSDCPCFAKTNAR
ncbi:hypothetical protein ABIC07_009522, partial [Bradyrhizobium sp. RT9a]